MPRPGRLRILAGAGLFLLALGLGLAQSVERQQGLPDPIPPPKPRKPPPEDASAYVSIVPESSAPWGLPADLLEPLYARAAVYRDYTRRFTCDETARMATYDDAGVAAKEKIRQYAYLLVKAEDQDTVREYRQELTRSGSLKSGEVKDEEPFPPAYAWVFLFSKFNEPYFALRYLGERFDGFDWVHEIQFRGSLPFSDGKDIRQWEGVVLIDAVTFTPVEIRAEPAGQRDRLEALYRNWSKSFNLLNMRTGPRPLGYSARIEFRYRQQGLSFPTEMRYDTFRAVGVGRVVATDASTRTYRNYRITEIRLQQQPGDKVEQAP